MENKKSLSAEEIYEKANKSIALVNSEYGHSSGVVISKDGLILTNFHCYTDKDMSITVDNKIYKLVEVVAGDIENDLILLKVEAKNLKPLFLTKSETLKVGSKVYTIGTPLSIYYLNTITDGIISGIRNFIGLNIIQTNASINPGNSGGALLNEFGELIGITQSSAKEENSKIGKETLTRAIHWRVVDSFLRHKQNRVERKKLQYKKYLFNGYIQMKQNDYKNALKSYNKYISHFRKDSQAYLLRGQCYEKIGYFKPEAEKDYTSCIKYDDKKNLIYSEQAYLGLYRMFNKKIFITKAIKINPDNIFYNFFHNGMKYIQNKEYELAELCFQDIIIYPSSPEELIERAYVELANLSFKKRDVKKCIKYLEEALKYIDEDNLSQKRKYLLESAQILYNENYKDVDVKYIDILNILLFSNNNYNGTHESCYLISKCYADLFDYNRAYINLLDVLNFTEKNQLKERNEFKYYYGLILKNVKKDNSYLSYFQEVLDNADVTDYNDLELIAEIHNEMGSYNQALNEFKKVLKMLSDDYAYPNRKKYLKNKISKIKNILNT